MNSGQGGSDDLFATEDMVKISAGVMSAGIAIAFVIYWVEIAFIGGV